MSSPTVPAPAVSLLRHTPPDGPPHFDWLIDLSIPTPDRLRGEGDRVPTFRVQEALDACPAGCEIAARRIADHRRFYLGLTEERVLSDNRGTVRPHRHGRILEATVIHASRKAGAIELLIRWDAAEATELQRLRLTPGDDDRWVVRVVENEE
ncbi:MAG: hypothetical protein ACO4BU_06280 [Phycisphaerales bacterium]